MGLDKLRFLLKTRGMNIKQLSEITNIPESTLNKIVGGFNKNPGYNTVRTISHALNLTVDELVMLLDLDIDSQDDLNDFEKKYFKITESQRKLVDIVLDFFISENERTQEEQYDYLIAASGAENLTEEQKEENVKIGLEYYKKGHNQE